jgi:hypothetical protein
VATQIVGESEEEKSTSRARRAPFDQFRLFIALDEPLRDRKQEAHGEAAHQHACNAFHRTREAPPLREVCSVS